MPTTDVRSSGRRSPVGHIGLAVAVAGGSAKGPPARSLRSLSSLPCATAAIIYGCARARLHRTAAEAAVVIIITITTSTKKKKKKITNRYVIISRPHNKNIIIYFARKLTCARPLRPSSPVTEFSPSPPTRCGPAPEDTARLHHHRHHTATPHRVVRSSHLRSRRAPRGRFVIIISHHTHARARERLGFRVVRVIIRLVASSLSPGAAEVCPSRTRTTASVGPTRFTGSAIRVPVGRNTRRSDSCLPPQSLPDFA